MNVCLFYVYFLTYFYSLYLTVVIKYALFWHQVVLLVSTQRHLICGIHKNRLVVHQKVCIMSFRILLH